MSKNKGVKKTLAVFMAVLMVMSCWVFTPISFEAEAATMTAGTYNVVINYNVDDTTYEAQNAYTGKSNFNEGSDENNKVGFSLYYKTNNGTGIEYEVYWDIGKNSNRPCGQASGSGATVTMATAYMNKEGSGTAKATLPGFPTKLYAVCDNATVGAGSYNITSIVVNNTTIWAGTIHMDSSYKQKYGTLTSDYNWSSNDSSNASCSTSTRNWNYPKATTVVWTQTPSNITIAGSTTIAGYCKDQYGVKLACDPTYSLSTNPSNTAIKGTRTNGANASSYKIEAPDAARMEGQGKNSCAISATASYTFGGATVTASQQITANDPSYNVTLKANGGTISTTSPISRQWGDRYNVTPSATWNGYSLIGFYPTAQGPFVDETSMPTGTKLESSYIVKENSEWYPAWRANKYNLTFSYKDSSYKDTSETTSVYYTQTISSPEIPQTINVGVDYTYTFKAWDPAVPSTMPANDVTYTATYNQETHYATLTELIAQIGNAEAKMNESLYTQGAYTAETVSALESAYNAAKTLRESAPLKSQQSAVDLAAENLQKAIANLQIKKFTVLFVDESGAILKNGYWYVSYGDKVAAPTNPEKESDHEKHYTFSGWVSGDSDDLSACDYVIDDLKYVAKFTAEDHNFTPTTINSTCTTDGATKYTCSCGYSYTEANTADKAHHSFVETTIKEETCSDNGIKANVCSVCDVCEKASIVSIPKKSHTYSGWKTYTAATCAGEGVEYRECACGAKEYRNANKIAHSFGETTVVVPTCTAKGYSIHTCSMCGLIEIFAETKANGHNITTNTVQPTCVSVGYEETKCGTCGHTTVKFDTKLANHTYGDWTIDTAATCYNKGTEKHECSNCHKVEYRLTDMLDHNYDTVVTAPTCTNKGYTTYTCKDADCGHTYISDYTDTVSNNHIWSGTKTIDSMPTCTANGQKSIHCTLCGAINDSQKESIASLGHDYTIKVEAESEASTCCSVGYTTYKCSRCDDKEKKYSDTLGDHAWGVWTTVQEVSATQSGIKVRQCSVCELYEYEYTAPTGDHIWNDGEITTPATCESEGVMTYTCKGEDCTICISADKPATKTESISATGHKWNSGTSHDADCTHGAYTTYSCENGCGKTYDVVKDGAKALGHVWGDGVQTKAATCTEDGVMTFTCTRKDCGETRTEAIAKIGHTMDSGTPVAATCTSGAYTIYKCTNSECGFTYNDYDAAQPAIGHTWGNWTVTPDTTDNNKLTISRTCQKDNTHVESYTVTLENGSLSTGDHIIEMTSNTPATCHSKGSMTFECTAHKDTDGKNNCAVVFTVATDMTAHTLTTIVDKAECGKEGSITVKCTNDGCTYNKAETIPALGHDYVKGTHVDADCTHSGYDIYSCSRCSSTMNVIAENVKPHTWKEVENSNTATCTDSGTATHECTVCHSTITVTTTALGHDWKSIEVIPGNCGTKEVTRYECSRCHITKDVVTGSTTTGEHDFEFSKTVSATCAKPGYDEYVCSVCKCTDKQNVTPALGHDWGDWSIVSYPTETEDGLQERFCQRDGCGARDEQIIIYGKFYLVTFYNYDGTRLMPPAYYEYGTSAIRPRKNPVKAADTAYTYEFIGWSYSDKQINFVSERMAIIAQYAAHERHYDVTYKNEDGSVLATVKNVGFSQIADKYPNPTPTKASDSYYDYTFGSWSISCDTNKSEAIATATYKSTPKKYEPPADTGSSSEEDSKENLFTRIINWIKNFFNKLFGRG